MIYLDSCIVIYAVESLHRDGERARSAIDRAQERLVISPMVIHETLVGPLRSRDHEAIDRMESFLSLFEVVDLHLPAFIRAAQLRAVAPGLRAPDSLHVAAAQLVGCTQLWTNDKRLSASCGSFAVDVIGDS